MLFVLDERCGHPTPRTRASQRSHTPLDFKHFKQATGFHVYDPLGQPDRCRFSPQPAPITCCQKRPTRLASRAFVVEPFDDFFLLDLAELVHAR